MKSSIDSIGLFIKQIKQHTEILTELLAIGPNPEQASRLMERCMVSTNMLSGSTAVMGLEGWQDCLSACEALLSRYRNLSLPWDERIAQIVSELIEKEDLLISAHEGGEICDLNLLVSPDELQALLEEANALLDSEPDPGESQPESHPAAAGGGTEFESGSKSESEAVETAAPETVHCRLFPECGPALEAAVRNLFEALADQPVGDPETSSSSLENIHQQLSLIDFYARSMNEIVHPRQGRSPALVTCSLRPLEKALLDYADGLCAGQARRMRMEFNTGDIQIDAALLFDIGRVLQWMIHDVYNRSDEDSFQVSVTAAGNDGAIKWELKDNGNNFISDSQFDHEEILAFYPSLKSVRRVLDHFKSVLWVEPGGEPSLRFAFTSPVSPAQRSFRVWGEGENSFAVLSTQLCSIESKEAVEIRTDARGDYMVIDNQRVPLIKLDLLYSTAPEQGDRIALIGALEKRFAFYTDGEGRIETGEWLKDAVSTWKGHLRGAAQLGHRRVPLLEAEELMSQYVMASGDRGDQEISGGVVTDEMDLSQGQATYEKDSASPPESNSSSDELDILVVERSSTVTEAFESIFKRANYKFEIVVSVEAAMAILRARPPRLIISEFRMPAMAARLIKDRMKEEGLDIPLLVTTSHSGTNAQLLVEKLGVWGYLSKPLDEETVFAKLNNCFQEKSTAV